ncbi:transmembrane protein 109 isoform X2 [Astyanax mexicanus]|uniref:Si:dkey-74k8.3 n=1 Tax=Astyanax mexicanus TaxID=7994 RepID=A0A8B9R4B7_ASTMX|nr:transmembrane protein 109 isoform X2 [Astyanax mexicanus]
MLLTSPHCHTGALTWLGLLLLAATAGCREHTPPLQEPPSPAPSPRFSSAAVEYVDLGLGYVESVVGTQVLKTCGEFMEMVLRFVAEGTASGLNVIAVYVSEILRATGFGDPVSIPHFTPEGVSSVVKYALLGVIGYWLVCAVLRASIGLLRRVFWLLKSLIVIWLFLRIISDPSAAPDTTAVRVSLLVIICALVSVAAGGTSGTNSGCLEERLSTLEGRVQTMEKCKTE